MRVANKSRFIIFIIITILISASLIGLLSKAIRGLFQHQNEVIETQTTIIEEMQETKDTVIIIDAGHGGFDNGTTSPFSGVQEQDLNLQVAKKLQDKFESNGYTVVMTRKDENALASIKKEDMDIRQALIQENTTGISISIHMNSYDKDENISGPEVYYYPEQIEGQALARSIQQTLNDVLDPPNKRTIKSYGFKVLKKAKTAAVLIECGFITNRTEEALLRNDNYQLKLADAIYQGAVNYIGTEASIQ